MEASSSAGVVHEEDDALSCSSSVAEATPEVLAAREIIATGLSEGKSAQQIKEVLQSKHKSERKALRKSCNDALNGLKGAERDAVESKNASSRESEASRHKLEMDALDAELESALAELEISGKGASNASAPNITRAQKRREKKKSEQKSASERLAARQAAAGPSRRDRELEALAKKLDVEGSCIKEVEADGHCLYRAVADQLVQRKQTNVGESKEPHKLLRTMCAQYMRSHRAMFEPFIAVEDEGGEQGAKSFEEYLNTVQNTSEWGGQLELRALAGALQTPIRVLSATAPDVIMGEDFSGEPLRVTFHQHFLTLGEHYNSVQPKSNTTEDDF